jgi:ribosomal protein S27AE
MNAQTTTGRLICAASECERRTIEGADYCKPHNNGSVVRWTCPSCSTTHHLSRDWRRYRCGSCSITFNR